MDDMVDEALVTAYRRDGFVNVPSILTPAEVGSFAAAATAAVGRLRSETTGAVFSQHVQVWQSESVLRQLTLHPRIAAVASALAGVPLRLWHDQLLVKQPRNEAPTEFHQDAPYWPLTGAGNALSAWIALVDVPVERGCMTFIPGRQSLTGLRAQDLTDSRDLMGLAPELTWDPRITLPLKAGDCTFHSASTPHAAGANTTDDPRIAHVVIYVDESCRFTGGRHAVTDPLGLAPGEPLPDQHFPIVGA